MSLHPNLLSRAQVLERLGGRSTSWLYQEMAEGRVPRPIRLGLSQSLGWSRKSPITSLATLPKVASLSTPNPAKDQRKVRVQM